jgi:hypothetical protein
MIGSSPVRQNGSRPIRKRTSARRDRPSLIRRSTSLDRADSQTACRVLPTALPISFHVRPWALAAWMASRSMALKYR